MDVTFRNFYSVRITPSGRGIVSSGFDPDVSFQFDSNDPNAKRNAASQVVQFNSEIMDFLNRRGLPVWKWGVNQIKGHYEELRQEFQTRNDK